MSMTTTNELVAVNMILAALGEAPINSFETAGSVDAAMARDLLKTVTREHQSEGWDWNQEDDWPFTPEGFPPYEIKVPDTVLALRPMDRGLGLVLRGGRIYDRGRKTFSFPGIGTIHFRVVWHLPFEDMPETDRRLVTMRAARIFASRALGDRQIIGYADRDEHEAAAASRRQSARSSRANLLNSWSVGRALRR